ncbi:hypothetical protein ABKV19_008664 [Rosa sericea]
MAGFPKTECPHPQCQYLLLNQLNATALSQTFESSSFYARENEPSAKQHFMSEVYLTMRIHYQENSAPIDGLMRFLLKLGTFASHISESLPSKADEASLLVSGLKSNVFLEAMGVCDHEQSCEEVRHQKPRKENIQGNSLEVKLILTSFIIWIVMILFVASTQDCSVMPFRKYLKAVLSVIHLAVPTGSSSALLSPKFTW